MYYNYIFYLQLDICHNVLQGSDYVGGISIRVYLFFFFCVWRGVTCYKRSGTNYTVQFSSQITSFAEEEISYYYLVSRGVYNM